VPGMLSIVRRYYPASQHYVNFHAIALSHVIDFLDKNIIRHSELEIANSIPRNYF